MANERRGNYQYACGGEGVSRVTKNGAKETFDRAIARAKYIQILARGLTNYRKRKARRDWGKSFKQLMHWPLKHKIERVDSRDVILVLRDGSKLKSKHFSSEALDDLLRASFVMTLSAMDAYFHAKIIRHVVQHSKASVPSNRLLNEKILVSDFMAGQKYKRTNQALRIAIERKLSYQSLQTPDKIADSLQLIGVNSFWDSIAKEMKTDPKKLKSQVTKIAKRRNQIAHEGDVSQSKKARNKSRNIGHKDVTKAIELVCKVVSAAEKVINTSIKKGSKKQRSKKGTRKVKVTKKVKAKPRRGSNK